jgi:hypothetical protein
MAKNVKRVVDQVCCVLPEYLSDLCTTACVFREAASKHMACPRADKHSVCVAPCVPPCLCKPKNESIGNLNTIQLR